MTTTNCYLSRFLRSTKHDVKHELLKLSTSWSHWFLLLSMPQHLTIVKGISKSEDETKAWPCATEEIKYGGKKTLTVQEHETWMTQPLCQLCTLTRLPLYGYIYIYPVLSINGLRRNTFLENLGLWLWTAALSCDWLLPFYERNFIFWEQSVKPCRLASPTDWNFWALQNLT